MASLTKTSSCSNSSTNNACCLLVNNRQSHCDEYEDICKMMFCVCQKTDIFTSLEVSAKLRTRILEPVQWSSVQIANRVLRVLLLRLTAYKVVDLDVVQRMAEDHWNEPKFMFTSIVKVLITIRRQELINAKDRLLWWSREDEADQERCANFNNLMSLLKMLFCLKCTVATT